MYEHSTSVILVNYKSSKPASLALHSLLSHNRRYVKEIVVVDNSAGCDNLDFVDSISRKFKIPAKLIKNAWNMGFAAGINRGAKNSTGDFLLFLNPDTVTRSDILAQLTDELEKDKQYAAISPLLTLPDGKNEVPARRMPDVFSILGGSKSPITVVFPDNKFTRHFMYAGRDFIEKIAEVEALYGTFLLVKREAFMAVKGFDERFFLFEEDLDLSKRLRDRGYGLLVDLRASVLHNKGLTRKHVRLMSGFAKTKSVLYFMKKHAIVNGFTYGLLQYMSFVYVSVISFFEFLNISYAEKSWKV